MRLIDADATKTLAQEHLADPYHIISACAVIDQAETVDAVPVTHGFWMSVFQDGACSWSGQCSVCKSRNDIPHPLVANYCPNCGAKMDGGDT